MNEPDTISRILNEFKTIAVIGLSDKPERDSYQVAKYMRDHGYRIIPVNPMIKEWMGEKSYPDLKSVPEQIDVVDIFRRSEFVADIVDEAIEVGAKAVWMQLGVIDEEAAKKAEAAGLLVVMDKCMKIEHSHQLSKS
jgi:predicted CoA-binding protein